MIFCTIYSYSIFVNIRLIILFLKLHFMNVVILVLARNHPFKMMTAILFLYYLFTQNLLKVVSIVFVISNQTCLFLFIFYIKIYLKMMFRSCFHHINKTFDENGISKICILCLYNPRQRSCLKSKNSIRCEKSFFHEMNS